MTRVRHSHLSILTGAELLQRRLARIDVVGDAPGPCVWLTACVHGDEVGGTAVIHEIVRWLTRYGLPRGTVSAFPLLNPFGFEAASRTIPFSGEDLNRSFPGDPHGSMAERIAHVAFQAILQTEPTVVLDLHNDWRRSIPYTLLDDDDPKLADLGHATGLLAVRDEPTAGLDRSLSGSLVRHGVMALTLELGQSQVVDERSVQSGVHAVRRVLSHLGLTDDGLVPPEASVPRAYRGRSLRYSQEPSASKSGILRFLVDPGEVVKRGRHLARMVDVFGRTLGTVDALREGIVLGHTDSSVSFPGVPVVAFAVPDEG